MLSICTSAMPPELGRRRAEDGVVAVSAADRRADFRLVAAEVGRGDETSSGRHFRHDLIGDRTGVESIGTVGGDACQGTGEIRLRKTVTRSSMIAHGPEARIRGGILSLWASPRRRQARR